MTRALLSGFQMNNPELIAPVNLSDHLHYDMEEKKSMSRFEVGRDERQRFFARVRKKVNYSNQDVRFQTDRDRGKEEKL